MSDTKLFRKNIEPSCAYCKRGTVLTDTEVLCMRKGITNTWGSCRVFRYDPYKRDPPQPLRLRLAERLDGGGADAP